MRVTTYCRCSLRTWYTPAPQTTGGIQNFAQRQKPNSSLNGRQRQSPSINCINIKNMEWRMPSTGESEWRCGHVITSHEINWWWVFPQFPSPFIHLDMAFAPKAPYMDDDHHQDYLTGKYILSNDFAIQGMGTFFKRKTIIIMWVKYRFMDWKLHGYGKASKQPSVIACSMWLVC